jgi:CRP/FNR family transcriptional regulator, cyclic AMP receptor protein
MLPLLERRHGELKQHFAAGTDLLSEGDKTGRLYILAAGAVEVVRNGVVVATINEPGSVFGEMSILLDVPHTATVRTTTDSDVYELKDADEFMKSDPIIALAIARMLAQRLNSATSYLVDLKKQYAGQNNHLGMVSDVLASLVFQKETQFNPGSDRQPDHEM